jgi:hypothetical protein
MTGNPGTYGFVVQTPISSVLDFLTRCQLIVTNRDNQHRKRRVLDRVVMTVLGFIRDGLLTRSA